MTAIISPGAKLASSGWHGAWDRSTRTNVGWRPGMGDGGTSSDLKANNHRSRSAAPLQPTIYIKHKNSISDL